MTDTLLFDRERIRRNKRRAASDWDAHAFLFQEVAGRLVDRFRDLRTDGGRVLDLGCHGGELAPHLAADPTLSRLVQMEAVPALSRLARSRLASSWPDGSPSVHPGSSVHRGATGVGYSVMADEEYLPFAAGAFDAVLSNLALHGVNDLPGTLIQLRHCLQPDGLFLAALFGGETLRELRDALLLADMEISGGARPRVAPSIDIRTAGSLLTRSGFTEPVVDIETVTVRYLNILQLMHDLRGMGQALATNDRGRHFTRRSVFLRASELYAQQFGGKDGRLPATFQILFLTAWAPSGSRDPVPTKTCTLP